MMLRVENAVLKLDDEGFAIHDYWLKDVFGKKVRGPLRKGRTIRSPAAHRRSSTLLRASSALLTAARCAPAAVRQRRGDAGRPAGRLHRHLQAHAQAAGVQGEGGPALWPR